MAKSRKREVQRLLKEAQELVDMATAICKADNLDGVSFMGQTFRCYRTGYNGIPQRIHQPNWYTDEYWCSSDAACEIRLIEDEEEETP